MDSKRNGRWIPEGRNPVSGNGHSGNDGPVVITGGAGFIGTNLAARCLDDGRRVVICDNFSRAGVRENAAWLREMYGERVRIEVADVRDASWMPGILRNASGVFHLAAQVAVTSSLEDPVADFEINARGTLNVIETLRGLANPAPLIFTSTNKVYGHLEDVKLRLNGGRYEPVSRRVRGNGVGEERALAFHSPYGCSKGAACQYVLDYARTFGLPAAVFRMSCIYGPHQFGNEDQGWVAHFLIRAIEGRPITIYGDGRQVRDVLYVEDLVDALLAGIELARSGPGEAFNIGGGPENTISLLELIELIADLHGQRPEVSFADWRPADQRFYVSDTRKFQAATGWSAVVPFRDGVQRLHEWLLQARFPTRGIATASRDSASATGGRDEAGHAAPRSKRRWGPSAERSRAPSRSLRRRS